MDRADELQTICEEVEAKWEMGGLSSDGGLYSDYAKEVARRFAALVRAQVIEEAARVCDRLTTALDHGGNEYRREASASQCAAAVRGMKSDSGHSATADAGASTAPLPEGERNQCDGCARGLPVIGGLHREQRPWDVQGCTADRYADALHAAIMNIPPEVDVYESGDYRTGYRIGHRDARQAAAELVAGKGADTGRHGPNVQAESGASLVKTADGEGAMR